LFVIQYIVQHIGIAPRGNDGGIRKSFGAVPDKFVQEFGLNFILPDARPYLVEYPPESFFGNITCLLYQGYFFCFFYAPDLLEDGIAAVPLMGRKVFLAPRDKTIFTGFGLHSLAVMFIGVEVNCPGFDHQAIEYLLKFR